MSNKLKELQINELKEQAHQVWLKKFGHGCDHKERYASVRHESGIAIHRCKKCGVRVD